MFGLIPESLFSLHRNGCSVSTGFSVQFQLEWVFNLDRNTHLWHAPTITSADRQAIVRQLLDRVIVTVLDDTEKVNVELHWAGGHRTGTRLIRPVARLEQLSYYPQLTKRVRELHQQGLHAKAIAASPQYRGLASGEAP